MNTNLRRALLIIGVIGIVFGVVGYIGLLIGGNFGAFVKGMTPGIPLGLSALVIIVVTGRGATARRLSLQSPVCGLKHISDSCSSHVCASGTVRCRQTLWQTPLRLLSLVNDGRHDHEPRLGETSEPILPRQAGSVVTGFRVVRIYEHLMNTMMAFKPVKLPNFIRTVLHCPLLQHRNVLCHVTVFQKYDP